MRTPAYMALADSLDHYISAQELTDGSLRLTAFSYGDLSTGVTDTILFLTREEQVQLRDFLNRVLGE